MPLINAYADVSSEARCLISGRILFIYNHTLCMRATRALTRLRICADSPQPSLLDDAIRGETSCIGPYVCIVCLGLLLSSAFVM